MIIGLTGPKLGGKGTTAAYLEKTKGAKIYSMSGILFDIAKRLHLPNSRENLISIVTGLRETLGEDILAKVLAADIEEAGDELAVIDGIRMKDEIDLFSGLKNFKLLYLDAPLEERYKRALARGEKDGESDMSFDEFKAEESAVTEQNIASFKELAQEIISNNDSLDSLYSRLESFIEGIGK